MLHMIRKMEKLFLQNKKKSENIYTINISRRKRMTQEEYELYQRLEAYPTCGDEQCEYNCMGHCMEDVAPCCLQN